ncbi:MAG: hypothetical protein DWQ37_02320 [Planctomycetota bacterium]|nr:MAG: hypothetical protein DWQ37_02320 [Planctomycetota bacterium]
MVSRRILTVLVTTAFLLPVAIVVILAVARLLSAMEDGAAALVLDRIALAAGVVWATDLVCLLLAVGLNTLGPPPES